MRRGQGRTRRGIALSFFVLALLARSPSAFALDPSLDISQYAHTAWKVRDSFVKSAITSLAQASDGYLWLGTQFGLYHFDGVRAVQWQPPPGQQLPSNVVTALLASRDGTLWIGTRKGLAGWRNGTLIAYPELSDQMVFALLEDREGTVWIGSSNLSSGRLCSVRDGSLQCRGEDGGLGLIVADLFEDTKGNLWLGVQNGVWRWKPGSPQFFSVPGDVDGVRFGGEDEGGLIIGGNTGVKRLRNGHIQPLSLPGLTDSFAAMRMLRDRDGALWIAAPARGLIHVHGGKTDVFSQSDTLTSNDVSYLLEDREGTVWVAGPDGLDRFRSYSVPTVSVKQGLSTVGPNSVLAARDGSVWVGTSLGLNKLERGKIVLLDVARRSQKFAGTVSRFFFSSMFQDSGGRLWVSTYYEFGYLEDNRFIPVTAVPPGYVHSITELPLGHFWVAHQFAGLFHLFQGRVVQQIPWAGLGHKDHVNVMVADPSQSGVWLGFFGGGVAYFVDGGIREYYSSGNGLGEGVVNDLRFGPRGALWVATEGGLSRIKDGKLANLTSKNGLPCDSVLWTMEDDDHAVWLLMPCGLVRVPKSELDAWLADRTKVLSTILFDNSDGVPTRSVAGGYSPQVTESRDGKIWFTAYDGVSVIDPHHLSFNKLPPPVHIEQITADDKTYDPANGLRLPARIRDLLIDYTALSLVAAEKVHFRVKLEGQDKDWRELNDRHVHYTNLAPRHYRFHVTACNNSGVWNEEGASLDFVIPPAWYQTNFFRALCVAAILMVVWGAHQIRIRQLRQKFVTELDARVSERTRIARELHDTLLQSFYGLLLRFQAVSNLLPERPLEAKQGLDTAVDQAAQAVTAGRDAVQELRSSTVVANDLSAAISTLAQELAAEGATANSEAFHIEVEGTPRNLHPILRDEVYRIAGEALRNAFRHAEARHIEVEIHYDERRLRLRVRDDGKGIDPEILGEHPRPGHFGLPGMRERAKIVGGRLEVWSELNSGTEMELSIPASKAYVTPSATRHSWWSGKGSAIKS